MSMRSTHFITAGIYLAVTGGLGSAAVAQSAPASTPAASSPVAAPQADTTGIGDIVVTAQRRSERINSIPISILAASGDQLKALQITTAEDLMQIVPDLRIGSAYESVNQAFTIRGIGPANQYNFNINAPVGIYMDEVYQAFQPAPGIQLFDLDRVEVLKGPQGTLYGRNTTGGAVNFISRQPGLNGAEPHANVQVGYSSFNTVQAQGASDLTFVDGVLGARVAVFYENGDGFMHNVGTVGPKTYGSKDNLQGRVALRFVPTSNFDANLKVYINRFHGSTPAAIMYGIEPGATNAAGYTRTGLSDREVDFDYPGRLRTYSTDGALTLNWQLGDFKLTSISSVEKSAAHISNDCDASPANICVADYDLYGHQWSQDIRGLLDVGPLSLTVGAFYGEDTYHHNGHVGFFGTFLYNHYDQNRRSVAGYFDATYKFTDKLKLTVGLRETGDRTQISNLQTSVLTGPRGTPVLTTIPPSATYDPTLVLPTEVRKSDGLTGRAILNYQVTPTTITYASFSHGYRAGAFNGQQFFGPDELNYVGPETDNNYELGIKAGLFDHRLQVNADVFVTAMKRQQVLSAVNIPGVASFPSLAGLGGRVHGAELEIQAALTHSLRAHANLTYLDTRYKNGQEVEGTPVGGHRFPFAPKFSAQGGIDWTPWKNDGQSFTVGTDVSYTTKYYFDPQNGVDSIGVHMRGQKQYALLDARASYKIRKFTFSVWAKNITDKFYLTYVSNAESSFGSDFGLRGVPRTAGGSVALDF